MSSGGGSRRGFLRDLIRGATESLEALRDDPEEPTLEPSFVRSGGGAPLPARPATHLASEEELRALCAHVGLAHRADDAVAAARVSVRLTPSPDGTSRIGGNPAVPDGLAWPEWRGERLRPVLDVDLASVPPAHDGRLLLFASAHAPAGRSPHEAGAVAVVHRGGAPAGDGPRLGASLELTLPPDPEALELSPEELSAWTDLREKLAAAQGVELEELAGDYHALHRVLGWPDAVAQSMEAEAELVARGLDLDTDDVDAHDVSDARWTLLFQVSGDPAGVELPLYERLYVWIRDDDLAAGRFENVRGFVR